MVYSPNIPQPNNRPSNSQPQLLENFSQLNTIFNVNHQTFNAATNAGKHTHVDMIAQAAPTPLAGEGSLYVFNTGGTREQCRYRRESSGTIMPVTEWIGGYLSFTVAAGVCTIQKQFNIAAVAYSVAGQYNVTFTTNLTDANYIAVGNARRAANDMVCCISNKAVGGFRVQTSVSSVLSEAVTVDIAIFGELTT